SGVLCRGAEASLTRRRSCCLTQCTSHKIHNHSLHDALPIFTAAFFELRRVRLSRTLLQRRIVESGMDFAQVNKTERSPLGDLTRSEEHTSELQSREKLVCRLLLEKKNKISVWEDNI